MDMNYHSITMNYVQHERVPLDCSQIMSVTKAVRQIIIDSWYRILASSSYSIDHIANIMIECGNEYDEFDESISSKRLVIVYSDNIYVIGGEMKIIKYSTKYKH